MTQALCECRQCRDMSDGRNGDAVIWAGRAYSTSFGLGRAVHPREEGFHVIIFGIVLLVIGYVVGIPVLVTIGGILVVVGVVLWILGSMGRAIGGRKHYY